MTGKNETVSRAEYEELLKLQGYEPTDQVTATGTYWIHKETKTFKQVPNDLPDDEYPEWMIEDLVDVTGRVGN